MNEEKRLFPEDIGTNPRDEIAALFANRSSLVSEDLQMIEDTRLRSALIKKLKGKNPLKDAEWGKIKHPSGIPIRRVRVLTNNGAAVTLRKRQSKELIIPGATHHVVIFTLGDNKCKFVPVSLLEASRRLRAGEPIVDRTPPPSHPEAEFLMSLCRSDTIEAGKGSNTHLFVYSTIASTRLEIRFLSHLDARKSKANNGLSARVLCSAGENTFLKNFYNPRKVNVLPTGELRRGED